MVWCRSGDRPLPEPMVVYLLTHICVTWLLWVNLSFQFLSVSRTAIEYIDDMAFEGNWSLSSLFLSQTSLRSMPPLDHIKVDLQQLSLQNNLITFIPRDYFVGFISLKSVILSSNLLVEFPNMTPLISTLEKVSLFKNKIEMIPLEFYNTSFGRLRMLYLQSNNISMFNYRSILLWRSLSYLLLESNRITLPDNKPSHSNCSGSRRADCEISLRNNPIHCNRILADITKLHIDSRKRVRINCFMVIPHSYEIYCSSPPQLCGRNLAALGKYNRYAVIAG